MTTLTASTTAYAIDADHSALGFSVRHMGISTFRGTLSGVRGSLRDGVLEGSAAVESISVRTPEALRQHLLSDEFFAAASHPEVSFASDSVSLADDGAAEVRGRLTIRNVSREIVAAGRWQAPVEDPYGDLRAALELTAVIDRRDYGMTWQMPLPRGGDALGNEVTLSVQLELIAERA
jgi:polyisoprenoid-binding protein YceI